MPVKPSIYLNGEYHDAGKALFKSTNRAFLYGDALFETIFCFNEKIMFLEHHLERLVHSMDIAQMRVPFHFNATFLYDAIIRLLRRNKLFMGARVRVTVFRNDGGLYTPETNEISLLIECSALENPCYQLNEEGYTIDVFTRHSKPINPLSMLKSANAMLYVMASNYRKSMGLDECIILNQEGFVCETISSNIFLVKEGKVYAPSLETGCLPGVMRRNILAVIKEENIPLIEAPTITPAHVAESDECFLTNAINGVRWVKAYKDKRYVNKMACFFVKKLNTKCKL